MREHLDTLLSELKKLRQQGVSSLLIEPDTLTQLESSVRDIAAKSADRPTPKAISSTANTPDDSKSEQSSAKSLNPDPKASQTDILAIPEVILPEGDKSSQWNWLRQRVQQCEVCNRHVRPGKKVVFGVGDLDADIFFCGEAPGEEEEVQGEPFVGPAGQLLTRIIQAMGLSREQVYIGNIMNWRPETDQPFGNRPPTEQEMTFCLPYLKAQVAIVRPKVIVALGATAVNGLLGYDAKRSITRSHGQWHDFEGIPTLISFHPSYILRNGTNRVKRLIWEDMLAVMQRLKMPISEKQENYFKS